ncbi:MAG: filamentous hemagglutinin N-terminal domain-containing protein [Nitrospirae bacterium]|nr:filamentous hemagglutinin N-terminal domain-containing protein [Nitrospirota bacterium]
MERMRQGSGNCFIKYVTVACLVVSYSISYAAVVTDGTVGWGGQLSGPKYIIPESIGTRSGNNLFQSFNTFNINTGESATFTGSSSIGNIIARVTGGASSSIDGTLSCGILGANLYLINPAGVMFGKNAALDLKGAFYVTTADYIKFSDGGRYDARTPANPILTSAPPSAFGFLTGNPSGVTVTGALLQVPTGKTLSIVGGDISITNGYLYAPGGQINIVSAASAGEALLSSSGVNAGGFQALGTIDITQTDSTRKTINGITLGNLDVSNQSGGSGGIYIVGGKFVIDRGQIFADSYGVPGGAGININVTGDMSITNGGLITSDSYGKGNAGDINIKSGNLSISGHTFENTDIGSQDSLIIGGIYSVAVSAGNAGNINVDTTNLSLTNAGRIFSWTEGTGNSGNIDIKASDSTKIS